MIIFMKRLLLLFAALIGFCGIASAQIGYNDVQFYVEAGQSWDTFSDYGMIEVVCSLDGKITQFRMDKGKIKNAVRQHAHAIDSPQFIRNLYGDAANWMIYKKDYGYSTNLQTVYLYYTPGKIIEHGWGLGRTVTNDIYSYFSLSNDGKVLKIYYNVDREGDMDFYSTYIRIDKNDMKPKASNSEFYD